MSDKSTLPSIDLLFKESFGIFKKSVLNLFIFNIIIILVWVAVAAVFLGILFALGLGTALIQAITQSGFEAAIASQAPMLLGTLFVFIPIFIIIAIVLSSIQQAGTILIINGYKEKISFVDVIKKSLNFVIPLFFINLLIFVIVFGGFFVFVIPALFFGFIFSFATYEVVLENKRWVGALKGSMAIVFSNFGEIFVRFLLLYAISLGFGLASVVLNKIFSYMPLAGGVFNLGLWVISIALGWFLSSYSLVLYKQSKKAQNPDRKVSMVWVWIISLIGWIIAIAVISLTFVFISALIKSDRSKNLPRSQYNQRVFPTFPTTIEKFNFPQSSGSLNTY